MLSSRRPEDSLEQRILELRDEGIEAGGGAAVVIDVETGDVLALASYPTYDLSTFNENYADLAADELTPMFNRTISGTYAPGSTFKIVTATAALSEGVITPETLINCEGTTLISRQIIFITAGSIAIMDGRMVRLPPRRRCRNPVTLLL